MTWQLAGTRACAVILFWDVEPEHMKTRKENIILLQVNTTETFLVICEQGNDPSKAEFYVKHFLAQIDGKLNKKCLQLMINGGNGEPHSPAKALAGLTGACLLLLRNF